MKKAVLVVSFGTSYHETRAKTIDVVEDRIKNALKDYDFYRAFTSNMIIKKLKNRDGIEIENPVQALTRLSEEGYKEVVVQTLHIICGEEYNKLKDQVKEFEPKFEKLTLGRPLLTTIEDYKDTVEAIKGDLPKLNNREAIVFMGHGTNHESHSAYPAIEYFMRDKDINAYVGTVEGYPEIQHVIKKIKDGNIEKVYLMPFMLVAGDHAINDMASDEEDSWKSILDSEGLKVEVILKGLGEYLGIQEKFMRHAEDCIVL